MALISSMDEFGQVDMPTAKVIEVEIDSTSTVWINVDGICRLRIGKVDEVQIENRHPSTSRWGRKNG